jgi:hypothetical protein
MADEEQKYRITYNADCHPEGIPKSEVIKQGIGGCDCLLIASILGQPGGPGGLSVQFASLNGFKGSGVSLDPMQEFNIFGMFAHYLMEDLPPGRPREICQEAFEQVQEWVLTREVSTLADAIIVAEKLKKDYDGTGN